MDGPGGMAEKLIVDGIEVPGVVTAEDYPAEGFRDVYEMYVRFNTGGGWSDPVDESELLSLEEYAEGQRAVVVPLRMYMRRWEDRERERCGRVESRGACWVQDEWDGVHRRVESALRNREAAG
jgi:hypothetical protein